MTSEARAGAQPRAAGLPDGSAPANASPPSIGQSGTGPSGTGPAATRAPGGRVPGWSRVSPTGRYVAVLALLSALTAVLLKHHLYPYLSVDNDEALYRLQARTLAGGHLFPPAPAPAGSYAPWLAAVVDGHYVLKYTPIVPGLFAASILLTGGMSAALALVAAAAVVVTYLLAADLTGDRVVGAVAATLLALSPLVIVQSALILPYLPVLVLFEIVVLGLLRALRSGRGRPLVAAGLALGFAVAVRPYDVVLFLSPMLVWVVARHRARLWWGVRWLAAGLVVPLGILFASNAAATGSVLRLPFALLEPQDKLGFGTRRLYPSDHAHHFGLVDGLAGVGNHLYLLLGWAFGGVVLIALAVWVVARRRASGPETALGAGGLVMLLGYVGFWGAWNAADLWGGIRYVGPFYVMPLLIPLVVLGGRGLVDLARWRPPAAVAATVLGAAASIVALVVALPAGATFTSHDRALTGLVDAQRGPSLVFVAVSPPYLMHPTSVLANPPELDGRVLYAVARGAPDARVLADHPDRRAYLLRLSNTWNHTPGAVSVARLESLTVVTGGSVALTLDALPPAGVTSMRLVVTADGASTSYPLDPAGNTTATLTVSAGGVTVTGAGPADSVTSVAASPDASVSLAIYARYRSENRERQVDGERIPVVADPGGSVIRVLAPSGQVGVAGTTAPPVLTVRPAR